MNLPGVYDIFNEKWGAHQTIWIISDTHFGDEEIKQGYPLRPTDGELIKKINSKVGKRDILILLGDAGDVNCVRQLKGYKILVQGNHDSGKTNYERFGEHHYFDRNLYSKEEVYKHALSHYPGWKINVSDAKLPFSNKWFLEVDNCLFDEVYEGALIIGEKLILSHEPVDIPWLYNIHGHDHAGAKRPNHMNVCSDVIGYEPINFNQFLKAGHMSKIQTIHRETIDKATDKKKKRGGKINASKR
jgi:calcineurin-like phosphoesterase family protein